MINYRCATEGRTKRQQFDTTANRKEATIMLSLRNCFLKTQIKYA